jgi:biopolymer transport protein TolR
MAISTKRKKGRAQPFCEINITPMVDVMLVLLVIFMVAAPMMTTGVSVDLPSSNASAIGGQDEPLSVTIAADGKIYLQKTPIELKDLQLKLRLVTKEKKDTRIFVRGDRAVDYGKVMQAVGEINAAGYNKVALITESVASAPAPANKGKP